MNDNTLYPGNGYRAGIGENAEDTSDWPSAEDSSTAAYQPSTLVPAHIKGFVAPFIRAPHEWKLPRHRVHTERISALVRQVTLRHGIQFEREWCPDTQRLGFRLTSEWRIIAAASALKDEEVGE